MKNILFLQNIIPHYRKSLYNHLSKYYNVTVLHSGRKTSGENDSYDEIITELRHFGPFFIQSGVFKEVKSSKYDIIITMLDLRWVNNILSMYLHNKNAKFMWWGSWLTNNKISNMFRIYIANKQYISIFYTNESKDHFAKQGIDNNKLFVANNTFDVGIREKSYNNKIKNRIIFVGCLDKRKQNDILITSFHHIKDSIPNDINITIIGDGIERENLEYLVKKLNLADRVFFLGEITDTTILVNYYKEAICSVSFGQAGLSVLQSLGYGVPFLTKKSAISGGEKTNIIDGVNGIFCDDNKESLEKNIISLCTNIDFARKLGENAYHYYSKYCTINNMAQGFIDAIENTRKAEQWPTSL